VDQWTVLTKSKQSVLYVPKSKFDFNLILQKLLYTKIHNATYAYSSPVKRCYCLKCLFFNLKNIRTKSFDDNTKILENEMKKIIASSLVMLFVLAGCNTVKGIGEDVSSAGNAVSNTAEKTQDEIRK
jgi:entericidin B